MGSLSLRRLILSWKDSNGSVVFVVAWPKYASICLRKSWKGLTSLFFSFKITSANEASMLLRWQRYATTAEAERFTPRAQWTRTWFAGPGSAVSRKLIIRGRCGVILSISRIWTLRIWHSGECECGEFGVVHMLRTWVYFLSTWSGNEERSS